MRAPGSPRTFPTVSAYAHLPDDELVRLTRHGDRGAFAVLYHRHVRQVYATVAGSVSDGTVARGLTVAAFSDALRHLDQLDTARVGATLQQLARRRAAGHTRGTNVPALNIGAVDAMWRELDQRWPSGEPPRKDPGAIVPITAGALIAVLVLGAMLASSRRSGTPDPTRTFDAVALSDDANGSGAGFLPTLPPPPVVSPTDDDPDDGSASEEPAVVAPTTEPSPTATPSPVAPTPTAEPTPGGEPSPDPEASPDAETDEPPEVSIISPEDGETRTSDGSDDQGAYATVVVSGVATDDRDPAESLDHTWTSSIDGVLLRAASGEVRLHVPPEQLAATHQLTFTVTDTGGNTNSASVTVTVTRV